MHDFLQRLSPDWAALAALHVADALMVWACVAWLSPWLAWRYPHALAPRLWVGLPVLLAGAVLLFAAIPGENYEAAYRAMIVSAFVYGWLLMREHANSQAARALVLQLETDALGTALDRSELAMLEAQIEPHFLFNTLAHVKRLYRLDAHAAGAVLQDLIAYLQRAVPALRKADWRVADELELIGLYLSLIEQRFGTRLRFSIDSCAEADAIYLPALTVATLVENAVRHGLGPKAGPGLIQIAVGVVGHTLSIDVSDDGVGLRQTSGSGLGLATVRARLQGKFGSAASLVVAPGDCAGVRASIRVALEAAHA